MINPKTPICREKVWVCREKVSVVGCPRVVVAAGGPLIVLQTLSRGRFGVPGVLGVLGGCPWGTRFGVVAGGWYADAIQWYWIIRCVCMGRDVGMRRWSRGVRSIGSGCLRVWGTVGNWGVKGVVYWVVLAVFAPPFAGGTLRGSGCLRSSGMGVMRCVCMGSDDVYASLVAWGSDPSDPGVCLFGHYR